MHTSIYVTYDPNDQYGIGQSTALRLQTIASLYDIKVLLPFRPNPISEAPISTETVKRIKQSSYILVFDFLKQHSATINYEIDYALGQNKHVIRLHNEQSAAPDLDPRINSVFVEPSKTDESLHQIAQYLKTQTSSKKTAKNSEAVGLTFLAVALGLLGAAVLSNNK